MPAIFELLPYRLNDGTAPRDSRHFPYLAGHGYACVRVDQRGTGESDGLMLDEYLPQEQADGCEVIEWIAAQPWCTGAVGHGRHLVERIQQPADRGAPAAGAEGDRHALLHRRPLRRRRALRRRLRLVRHGAVGRLDVHVERAAARPGDRRRALARHVDRADGGRAVVHRPVDGPPAPRRLLEAGVGVRGLLADRGGGLRGGRLGRRLHQRHPADAGGAARPAQGPDRPVGARLAAGRPAGADDRLPPGGASAGSTTG